MTRAHRRLRRRLRRRARRRDASGYAGFRCTWINEPIATVDGAVDAATFFRRFVATRTPCLLRRYCASADLGCVSRCATAADPAAAWVEAVTRACGDAEVKVELRAAGDASGRAFGLGRERRLAVGRLVDGAGRLVGEHRHEADLQSVAISGNQWQPVAASGSQWQSVAISLPIACT